MEKKLIFPCDLILIVVILVLLVNTAGQLARAAENKTALVARPLNYDADLEAYVLSLSLGTPPQTVRLILDVESSAITKLSCSDNGSAAATSGSFDPSASSTFRRLRKTGGEDTVTLTDLRTQFSPTTSTAVDGVDVRCGHHSHGVAGFARGPESLPAQVTRQAGLPLQFAYCLPGVAIFGRPEAYAYLHTFFLANISASTELAHTRLLVDKDDGSYAVVLRNVTVDGGGPDYAYTGKPLRLRISTREPYTKLRRSIYRALRSGFRQAIGYGGLSPAQPAVPPFDTCFDPRPVYDQGGRPYPYPSHPLIVLQLDAGVSWTITPRNSFVSVGTSTACLGFVDAGPKQPSVLGTFQQQDWLLQFDLEHSLLSFTSIFQFQDLHPSTCSDIYS